ncbi:hypothetical protein [Desulfosporosinus orientis]|uniref:hypothetical protein n=1 Tax=Desulfosporosinus orientis TaxID=1563 RepID=UPI00030BD369|nr:hypothetical protein [Desulfosporosinus orientis]
MKDYSEKSILENVPNHSKEPLDPRAFLKNELTEIAESLIIKEPSSKGVNEMMYRQRITAIIKIEK